MINKNLPISNKRQKGFMALFVTIMLLVGISLVVIFTSNTVTMEQKISANQVREKQAFEHGTLGLDYYTAFAKRHDAPDFFTRVYAAAEGAELTVFDPAIDDALLNTDTYANSLEKFTADVATLSALNPNDTALLPPFVQVTIISIGEESIKIKVSSTGISDDETASRTVSKFDELIPPFSGGDSHPLIARNTIDITGAGEVQNLYTNANIWSGGSVAHSGSGDTYIANETIQLIDGEPREFPYSDDDILFPDADGSDSNSIPNRQQISDSSNKGVDILDNDSALSSLSLDVDGDGVALECDNEFFANFFQGCPAVIKDDAYEITDATSNDRFDDRYGVDNPPTQDMIWVEGDMDLNNANSDILGCTVDYGPPGPNKYCTNQGGEIKPIILIVNGNLRSNGTVDIYGVVYIKGDWDVQGTFNVYGTVIVEGSVSGGGTFNVYYRPNTLQEDQVPPRSVTVVNSWKDW